MRSDAAPARTRWGLLRSDEIRRQLQPTVGTAPARHPTAPGTGRYAPEAVGAVYAELVRRARELLERGEPVIIDASWIDAGQRAVVRRVAEDTGSDLIELCCSCDDATAAERIHRRQGGDDVSDATPEVRDLMAQKMNPWPSATVIDTSDAAVADVVSTALRVVAG